MGKLTEFLYDTSRHIMAASQAGIKKGYQQLQEKNVWELVKSEIRTTFHTRNTAAVFAVLMLTSVGVYTVSEKVSQAGEVYRVYIDGSYQGVVRDKSLIEDTITALGSKLTVQVKYEAVHQAVNSTSEGMIAYELVKSTKTFSEMVAIRVNGKDVVYVKDQATATALIEKIKNQYAQPNAKTELADVVDFVPVNDEDNKITPSDKAFDLIIQGTNEKKTYVVSRGDSLWDIASKNKMTVEELHEANPAIVDVDELKEGQKINLVANEPLINVETTVEETRELTTNYEIERRDDDSLYLGTEKVLQEGVPGKKSQKVRVIRKNGAFVSEEVLAEQVIVEPKKEIVLKGKKKQDYSSYINGQAAASGSWAYPIAGGYISSIYGENRGGKPHLAIDIAASTGTTVFASNGGAVIQAGDIGDGYGNCIRISHGNGVVTIYGHLSSMSVSVGQTVEKGQRIGGVGSTGWSTGSHLHYEVRVGGVQVNPAPYM